MAIMSQMKRILMYGEAIMQNLDGEGDERRGSNDLFVEDEMSLEALTNGTVTLNNSSDLIDTSNVANGSDISVNTASPTIL